MANRISFNQINVGVLNRIFENYGKLEQIQQELTTGKRVNKASDDPVGAANVMQLRAEGDRLGSYQRNLDDGLAYLATVDITLGTGNNLYQNMRERAIQAANDSNSAQSRFFIGQEVRGMFEQMVGLSNTSFKGQYLFSGTNTQVPPYEMRSGVAHAVAAPAALSGDMTLTATQLGTPLQLIDKNVTDSADNPSYAAFAKLLVPGTVKISGFSEYTDYTVDYVNGTVNFTNPNAAVVAAGGAGLDVNFDWVRKNEKDLNGVINRELEEGVAVRINSTAGEVFGQSGEVTSWEAILNLMEGTINNKPLKIQSSITQIDEVFKRQLTAQSINGARVLRLESTQERNDSRQVETSKLQSNIEDVDFAEAVSKFTLQKTVYEASLKMGAQAIQNTLMNFL